VTLLIVANEVGFLKLLPTSESSVAGKLMSQLDNGSDDDDNV